jgi:cyclophilin family peptidyl-prolyl cis-trans isomerase
VDFKLKRQKGILEFQTEGKAVQTDGFEPEGLPTLELQKGRIGYCKASDKFYIVRKANAKIARDCHSPFAEVTSGGEDLMQSEGHFKECSVPETRVHCSTTKGDIQIQFYPHWAPLGVARVSSEKGIIKLVSCTFSLLPRPACFLLSKILTLVSRGFYNDIFLWRVNGDIIQFGADQKNRPGFDDIRDIQIADDSFILEANPKEGLPKYRIAHAGAPVPNSRDVGIFFVTRQNKVRRLRVKHLNQIYTNTDCCLDTFCTWILTTSFWERRAGRRVVGMLVSCL